MPKPYPREFRDDVVRVARNLRRRRDAGSDRGGFRDPADFGIHPVTLTKWMRQVDVDDGVKAGTNTSESAELRELLRMRKCVSSN